jgi:MFS family permease
LKKLSLPKLLVLNAYWLGLTFMWNALHPIILPAVLLNYVPDEKKNTYLGLLTFLGLVIAMVVQPLSGAVSDGWKSRFGRRRPLMVLGTLFDFLFLSVLAWMGGLGWLFIGYIGLQLSSNIAHGPLQGLLPDLVPKTQLGVASSLKTFMDMFALVLASLLAGRMLDPETRDPTTIMLTVIVLLAITASITIFGVREKPTGERERTDWQALSAQFRVNFGENAAYWWLVLERAIFLLGIFGVQAFAQYYLQDVLRVPDPPRQTGDLLAILTISLIVLVLIGGWLTDKYGAKRILYIATFAAASGILLMVFARDIRSVFVFGSLLGAGLGLFLTSNWALANSLVPEAEAGKYLGLTNLATAGAGALARLEGPLLDWLNHLWPGLWIGYKGLFFFGGIAIFLSLFILRKIDVKPRENPRELQGQFPTTL